VKPKIVARAIAGRGLFWRVPHLTVTASDGRFRNEQVQTVKRPFGLTKFSSRAVFSSRSQESSANLH